MKKRKFWIEGYGIVGKNKANKIMATTHILSCLEVTGYDMRKVYKNEPIPYICKWVSKIK